MLQSCINNSKTETKAINTLDNCQASHTPRFFAASGKPISLARIADRASVANYVLIGETHDNQTHHKLQAELIRLTALRGNFQTVFFEMLSANQGKAITAFNKNGGLEADLDIAFQWTARNWPVWSSYYQVFYESRLQGLKVAPANMPDDQISDVRIYGTLAFPRRLRNDLNLGKDDKPLVEIDQLKAIITASHKIDEPGALALAVTQYSKDAYMAFQMASNPNNAFMIAGSNHVRNDIGIPIHLANFNPGAKTVSIGIVESINNDSNAVFDYTIVTGQNCLNLE